MSRSVLVILLAVSGWAIGCGSGSNQLPPLEVPPGCNPLAADWDCLLPYPSDFFLVDDTGMPSGKRVAITGKAQIKNANGKVVDLLSVHPADGFSHLSQILAVFPTLVDKSQLVSFLDPAPSLIADSPTQLLDAESGEQVPHFAELDPRTQDDRRRALVIRPLVRLEDHHRYIVGIHGLKAADGSVLPAPEGFRRIRDSATAGDPFLDPLADRYRQEIFPKLVQVGITTKSLQLAWDFTTETEEQVTRDMLFVRNDVIQRLTAASPIVTVTEAKDDLDAHIARRVTGTIRVPLYLDSDQPGAMLHRDDLGQVAINGEAEVPFTALIPKSVANRGPGTSPGRLLQFGHGFFGNRNEIQSGSFYALADRFSFVIMAVDWWGMSNSDELMVVDAISSHTSDTLAFTDRVHQAMANFIALGYAAAGSMLQLPEFQFSERPLYDPAQVYFWGVSQGHILGGTYLALAPLVERGVLCVGGAGFSYIMFRARPFGTFLALIETYITDHLDVQKFVTMTQTSFDRMDPITYAPHVISSLYPGGPAQRKVLLEMGLGDTQVPNLASELHARTLGVNNLDPAPRSIYLVDSIQAPADSSAIVLHDFHIDPLPGQEATPPESENQVHGDTPWLDAVQRQIDEFLKPGGAINATCDGVCDPE